MNPTQNPSALRSKKIITSVLLQLMARFPYAEISVKHILLEAHISRKTFYRNFSCKEDVLDAYIEGILHDYVNTLFENENYSFIKMLDTIFYFCEKHKEFLLLLRDSDLLYLFLAKLNILILAEHFKITRYNFTEKSNLKNRPFSEYIVYFNIGGIWNLIVRWLENDMKEPASNIKKSITCYLSDIKNVDLRDV